MTTSEIFDSYLPVYDTVPEKWEEARPFFVEQLRKITESLNVKEIGFYLNEQLLSGSQFVPGENKQEFRSIFRKVIAASPITAGANSVAHGINFNVRFTLIKLWVAGTDSVNFVASIITDDNVAMDVTNVDFTSPVAYDRGWIIIEYILEE